MKGAIAAFDSASHSAIERCVGNNHRVSVIAYAEKPNGHDVPKVSSKHALGAKLIGVAGLACLTGYVYWIAVQPDPDLWSIRQAVLGLVALSAVPVGYLAYGRQRSVEHQRQDDGVRQHELPRLTFESHSDAVAASEADAKCQPAAIQERRLHECSLAAVVARAELRDHRARYVEAAAQLGHDKAAIRLAGVYAMAQLADDWGKTEPAQRQTCIDVLCGYLRLPFPGSMPAPAGLPEPHVTPGDRIEVDHAELRVRETVVRTINQHLQPTAPRSWSGADFDFTGAQFPDDLARFDGAEFSGEVTSFERATFSGEQTSFDRATFSGEVASFRGATFAAARTSFDMATFSGARTSFERATFCGWDTSFHDATFSGAGTSFDLATFSGRDMCFDMATFSGARTSFDAAVFSCARTSFFGATFAGDFATFGGARFCGEDSTFYLAKFRGERMSFLGARFSGAHTSFNVIVGNPAGGTTSAVGIHARIESVLDFSDAQEEGQAELDLSGAELVGSGSVIAPKTFSNWTPPPLAA